MTALERWARAKGLWVKRSAKVRTTRPGWSVLRGHAGTRVMLRVTIGTAAQSVKPWDLDAVAAHLWALALDADVAVDCGPCIVTACCAGIIPRTMGMPVKDADGRVSVPILDGFRCGACGGSGRDVRSLALLVCQQAHRVANPAADERVARASAIRDALVVLQRLRRWVDLPEHIEARAIVADWRASQTTVAPSDVPAWVRVHPERVYLLAPERTAGEIDRMPASLVRPALLGDLAWWLRLWLDGTECGACTGTGRDYGSFVDCPDCWETGSVGHAAAMEAALADMTKP